MPRFSAIACAWILLAGNVLAQSPEPTDPKKDWNDPTVAIEERVRRLLQAATTLDQAAQKATSWAERREKWASAVGLIDDFVAANHEIEAAPSLRFQAGVYRWAEGQSFADQFEQKPGDSASRDGAMKLFDDAIRRLRSISVKPEDAASVFGQNVRYRLAQAIADRAGLMPDGEAGRLVLEREALALLDQSLNTPGLQSFTLLLRGQLCNRLHLFGEAQMELERAAKLIPPPPAESLLEARVTALSGRRQYDEALATVGSSKVGEPLRIALRIKVLLAKRHEMSPGRDRRDLDDQALALGDKLRGTSRPEGRRALMELARSIDEPGDGAPPDSWDLLAEGHLRLGNPARAGRLIGKGADRAEAAGLVEKAASLRYKSGAYLFEAGKYVEADQRLSQVIDMKSAPTDLKSRAGMLRSLARGRAIANREAGASRDGYLASLEAQVRDFPRDPSSGEARWLLGQIRLSAGKLDEALELWTGITHGHPRWLEAKVLIADRRREAVEIQRINRDSNAINARMDLARKSLQTAIGEANDGSELSALRLQVARLELTPEAGKPSVAIEALDQVLKGPALTEQRQTANLYRLVALAQANRGFEAEKAAQTESRTENPATLMPVLRLLDQSATDADSDVSRKRLGLIARIVTSRMVEHLDQLPAGLHDEARLHHVRALLLSGDQAAARKELSSWGGFTEGTDDELLRELTDTYLRLDAFMLAIDAERYRSSRLTPGSLPWLDARYGLALAYFRAERLKEARQVIDGTAILHPDLGGGELRVKFEKLRQKLGAD